MSPDMLKQIIDEIFTTLEAATATKPLLHLLVGIFHSLALSLVPSILSNLKARKVVAP